MQVNGKTGGRLNRQCSIRGGNQVSQIEIETVAELLDLIQKQQNDFIMHVEFGK